MSAWPPAADDRGRGTQRLASTDEPAAGEPPRRLRRPSLALVFVAVVTLVASLYFARAFIVPLLIGILASYALRPLVDRLQAWRIPRPLAAALVLGALVGGTSWAVWSLGSEATALVERLPEAARRLRQHLGSERSAAPTALQNMQAAANELQRAAADAGLQPGTRAAAAPRETNPPGWLRDYAIEQSALFISVAAQTPIVLLLAYFLLGSGDHFRRKLVQFVGPSITRKKDALRILGEIDSQVQRYLLTTVVSNAIIGLATWLVFSALGVQQAAAWGLFAGVLHFIPYLGMLVVALAAGVAGFLQFGSLLQASLAAGSVMLIGSAVGLVFTPWLQSRFAHVNAAVLFIALLFFGWLWGAAGLLLGAPLLAIAKVICDRVESLEAVGELLGS